jgi:hypothetical protein
LGREIPLPKGRLVYAWDFGYYKQNYFSIGNPQLKTQWPIYLMP